MAGLLAGMVEFFVVPAVGGAERLRRDAAAAAAGDLEGKLRGMPFFLGWPLRLLTAAFALYALAATGRRFGALGPEGRARVVRAWRRSPVGPCRDLVTFYEKMALFLYFSRCRQTT